MTTKPTTFSDAYELGAYPLAKLWADVTQCSIRLRRAEEELSELAVMSGLVAWLEGWRPIQIHRAILAGAGVDRVAAAYGGTVSGIADAWARWAVGQRDLRARDGGPVGITDEEYERVAAAFAAVRRGGDPGE